ncbi:MAG: phenylalanine--tRNA ligase subunit beta, partial [Clostridia bacterium]
MNLSMKWLSEFVDISVDAREFAEAMTMSGSKVETTTHLGASVINVVVGKIISIEKHPDADKLQICMVDVAEDAPLQIVTAATNVVVNALVPVAKNGSLLSDGTKIKTGKLRGVTSYGMFCSFHELGLNLCNVPYADEDGILLLQEPCKPGDDIRDVLGLNDSSVEFEITSNRPDCLCVIGLAREVAATFNRPITLHTPPDAGVGAIPLDVTVKAPELCPRYIARMVTDVTIAPSPMWLRARLHASGVRPVNNIVDITNYVLLEYGQPMHAFDANTVSGGGIIVRRAADGESFKTLDGATRTLTSNMLVIADETRALALAGVMGGENSEITSDTHTVIFESATFDAATTRMTARDLGMRTDASALYEKGLDVYNALPAINRACELVEMLGAGKIMQGLVDVFPKMPVPHTLAFEYERINALLGTTLAKDEMIKLLASINILENDGVLTIPSFRADVICTADVAEEVARLFGYNNIKSTLMSGESTQGGFSTWQKFKRSMCAASRSLGYSECSTYSFESPKYCDMLMLPTDCSLRRQVKILNPLGDETSVMRTSMLPSMLEVLARNYNNRNLEVDMFELGATYAPKLDADGEIDATLLPDERPVFAFGSYGKG